MDTSSENDEGRMLEYREPGRNVENRRVNNHRKLAIASIICGLSCLGIKALIYSVKAEEYRSQRRTDEESANCAETYAAKAKKQAILSILVWVLILIFTPPLFIFISYLFTLKD